MLSVRGLCDEMITRPEESYRLCCVVVCDLETSRMGAPYIYIYDISSLRVKIKGKEKDNLCLFETILADNSERYGMSVKGFRKCRWARGLLACSR